MALISTTLGRLYNFQPGTKAYSQNMDDELDAILIGVNKIVADLITLDSVKSEVTTVTDITGVGRTTQTIMSNFLLSTLAIDTANISNATANIANTKSDTAVATANSASTKSDTAVSTANGAVVTANAAVTKATEVETDYNLVKPLLTQAIIDANDAVDLVEETIVGTIFNQVGIIAADYVFTASVDGDNTFAIPYADYIPSYDYLEVMYDGIILNKDVNYTVVDRVVTILFNLLAGEKIAFRVSKNQMMPENYADGIWLEAGTVQKTALEQSLQDEINTLGTDLNTEEAALIAHKAESASKHITESGVNANGKYIKFDDGTMISRHKISVTGFNTTVGSMYRSDVISWVLPASFVGVSQEISYSAIGVTCWGVQVGRSLTSPSFQFYSATSTTGTLDVVFIAIGRWKA